MKTIYNIRNGEWFYAGKIARSNLICAYDGIRNKGSGSIENQSNSGDSEPCSAHTELHRTHNIVQANFT